MVAVWCSVLHNTAVVMPTTNSISHDAEEPKQYYHIVVHLITVASDPLNILLITFGAIQLHIAHLNYCYCIYILITSTQV